MGTPPPLDRSTTWVFAYLTAEVVIALTGVCIRAGNKIAFAGCTSCPHRTSARALEDGARECGVAQLNRRDLHRTICRVVANILYLCAMSGDIDTVAGQH